MGYRSSYTGNGSVQINFGEDENIALVLKFKVAGWSDAGQTYGPPERCYPPEGEEEREITGIELFAVPKPNEYISLVKCEGAFKQEVTDAFFEAFPKELEDAPFDIDEPDPQEWEAD